MNTSPKEYCIETVVSYHNNWPTAAGCSNFNGYGEDGKYCKMHSRKYAKPSRWIYAVALSTYRDRYDIRMVGFISETAKTITVSGLYGSHSGNDRVTKGASYIFFETEPEAIAYQITREENHIAKAQQKIDWARTAITALQDRLSELALPAGDTT